MAAETFGAGFLFEGRFLGNPTSLRGGLGGGMEMMAFGAFFYARHQDIGALFALVDVVAVVAGYRSMLDMGEAAVEQPAVRHDRLGNLRGAVGARLDLVAVGAPGE